MIPMALNEQLLKILACPETKSPVSLAPGDLIQKLNTKISEGTLRNHAGKPVTERMDAGLLREDGRRLYPILKDIPIMLIDEGIDL